MADSVEMVTGVSLTKARVLPLMEISRRRNSSLLFLVIFTPSFEQWIGA